MKMPISNTKKLVKCTESRVNLCGLTKNNNNNKKIKWCVASSKLSKFMYSEKATKI